LNFDFTKDPISNLLLLIDQAEALKLKEPNVMSLATVNKKGLPNVRAVLFKGIVRKGLSFYSNYNSVKAKELLENSNASVLFFWPELACQIRVMGKVKKLTRKESEKYFKTRPFLSQIGAWASEQSKEIESFEILNQKVQELEEKFKDQVVPCPKNWGGYHLIPNNFEFWFGKEGRLHERFSYTLQKNKKWKRSLKSP
jgi:pyridoxamine 5'-phosphate oxidase